MSNGAFFDVQNTSPTFNVFIAGQNFKYCGVNDESYNISYLNYANYGDYARMDLGTILNAGMTSYMYTCTCICSRGVTDFHQSIFEISDDIELLRMIKMVLGLILLICVNLS